MPRIRIGERSIDAPSDATVAAVMLHAGIGTFRRSETGEPRGPLCGIGLCMECRVTIDGKPHQLACQTYCREDMEIVVP